MDSKWKKGVEIACVRLLEEIGIVENIHLPYAMPYMNYVMSWKNHLPIKTVMIGQNPYPKNIYPVLGAALSYDPNAVDSPPRSVKAIVEDLYTYNKTPADQTIQCIRDSWHLLNNGTIMINETVLSMIYPELKSNCGPSREMEAQCIALQAIFIASYFMGQKEFTIIGMGNNAALMMDQMKKWCPSDAMKIKAIHCRNPAARERGDLPSRAFTLNHTGASKIISAEVAWYHSMAPKKDAKSSRLEATEKSLMNSFNEMNAMKNTAKTDIEALNSRMKELGNDPMFAPVLEALQDQFNNTKKSQAAYVNSVKSHQMQFIQHVHAAMAAIQTNPTPSEAGSSVTHKDIAKLAAKNPPRKKIAPEVTPSSSPLVVDIKKELDETPVKKIKEKITKSRVKPEVSVTAPSEGTAAEMTPGPSSAIGTGPMDTPTKKKKPLKNLTPEETVHVIAFANWFKNNVEEDQVYAGVLQTIAEDKTVGTSTVGTKVVRHIRNRKKEDIAYDAHVELQDPGSPSYLWSVELKTSLLAKE